ncbi:hypothetical protein O6H91_01G130100 [Diphasiastrum complanatum]|uniref:Uncharacterized protein n=1 Tax=Diphasiastrum complanatum TaxID=34168 RepID=A0ACC2EW16_DIPCM|nr:hypothetical protein O6H91_01G130100 [Diphasiastrum complanatum]
MGRENAEQMIYVIQFLVFLIFVSSVESQLQQGFYDGTCSSAEETVRTAVHNAIQSNRGTGAGLIRMHFHDCFVNGCDGSVLIDSTSGNQAEKDAPANNPSLHGFEVIDTAKSALESKCPGVVSCADILAFAARDSVAVLGGPSWKVRSGRRDGRVSRSSDVASNIPAPTFSLQQLTQSFSSKGLSQDDMITLSDRLYNFNSTTPQDPSLDPNFANHLKAQCPNGTSNSSTVVNMDFLTPYLFDSTYYFNLRFGRGLLTSDHALLTDSNTATTVQTNSMNENMSWSLKFAVSMISLSEIQVLTGQQGEIRTNCHVIN